MPFDFKSLSIPDVKLMTPRVFPDDRGFFLETYKDSDFARNGIIGPFRQDNQSCSKKGVLRGLHYQKAPHAQAKLVQVLSGRIFDVVVDLRPDSSTYRQWIGLTLDDEDHGILYVPEGFGHGFQVLSERALVQYKTSSEYRPEAEAGLIWNDPDLAINWPLPAPVLSSKDALLPRFRDAFPAG